MRSLELDHEARLRVLYLKVLQQRHRSSLGNEAAGADAQARRAKHQYLVVRGLGLGHHERSDEIHRGVGGRELHGGDLEVDRRGVELLRYLQREGDVLHVALEQTKHLGLAVHHLLIIFGKIVLLCQALDLVLRRALQLAGIRYARVADEVVDAPVGEQAVHDLRTGHRVIAAIGDHQTLVDLVLGVDADRVELHRKLPCQRQRFPYHVSRAGELAVADILQLTVEHEVVLANGHRLALQLVGLLSGRCLVVDDHLVGALEITLSVFLGQRKVDGVDAVVEIVDRGLVERARLDAQQDIVALGHLVLELGPTQGVSGLFHAFHRIDRLLQEHGVARRVGVSPVHLDVVDKLDAVGRFATSARELRLMPLHGYVAVNKLLAGSVGIEVARQHNLGIDKVVKRVGELLFAGFLVSHEARQGRHRPSIVAEEILYGALFRCGIRNGIYAHHVEVVRTYLVDKALGQRVRRFRKVVGLVDRVLFLHCRLQVGELQIVVVGELYHLQVIGEIDRGFLVAAGFGFLPRHHRIVQSDFVDVFVGKLRIRFRRDELWRGIDRVSNRIGHDDSQGQSAFPVECQMVVACIFSTVGKPRRDLQQMD